MHEESIRGIVHDVQAGIRTAAEVTEAALAAVAAGDSRIGAFVAVDTAGARRAARAVDDDPQRAVLPLAGATVAVKDNFDVADLPTRNGSTATSAAPVARDDELVARLRLLGAVIVGKTQMPELAIWPWTESRLGITRNPLDPSRNAGGSTGGGAAAVASGMAALAIGTDGGGSLRVPAANTGLAAVKPAPGLLPLPGGVASHWQGLTAAGLIARTVDDLELSLAALTGAAGSHRSAPLSRAAVSMHCPTPIGRPDEAARAGLANAGAALAAGGMEVRALDPPYPRDLISRWGARWLAGVAEEVDRLGLEPRDLEPRTRAALRRGRRILRRGGPDDDALRRWRDELAAFFDTVDVLLTPTIARRARPAGWASSHGYLAAYLDAGRRTPYTEAWNLAGYPAATVPVGLPAVPALSVQIVAPELATVLAVARLLAEATDRSAQTARLGPAVR